MSRLSGAPIRVRKSGAATYPWQAHCRLCDTDTLHVIEGVGAVAANTRGLGNRTHDRAIAAAHAHLLAEHELVTP